MFKVWWTNFHYYAEQTFDSVDKAVAYGKSQCFDFIVSHNDEPVCSWSVIGGLGVW